MRTRVLVALVATLVAAIAAPSLGAPPGPPQTRAFTLYVDPVDCDEELDRVCLAYNGQIPGPTLDVNLGDTLVITLVNNHTQPVSWHVHGTALSASVDGIPAHAGTDLIPSFAPAGGSFTYTVRAAYAGSWHYHDHVLGADGSEGVRRGLYGGLIVRNGAEPRADVVLDLHMLDEGPNGGRPLFANLTRDADGLDIEILIVGLGNQLHDVQLRKGTTTLDVKHVAPAISDRFRIEDATPGTYRLREITTIVGTIEVI